MAGRIAYGLFPEGRSSDGSAPLPDLPALAGRSTFPSFDPRMKSKLLQRPGFQNAAFWWAYGSAVASFSWPLKRLFMRSVADVCRLRSALRRLSGRGTFAVNLLLDISVNQEKLHKNFLKLEMAPWGRQMLVRSIFGSSPQAGFCGSSTRECHA
jgi:hypothetical protein